MFDSVTAASPNCMPVRREVLSTSGVGIENLFDAQQHLVGVVKRGSGRHDVVENESALIHFWQQVAPQALR